MAIDKQYTVAEAAEVLRLTTRTVFSYIYSGKIHAAKTGRKWIISERELLKITNPAADQTGADNNKTGNN